MEIILSSGRGIGDGHDIFIIAEVGSNWKTLDDCISSIAIAKACGADAVKFQLFDYEALYGVKDLKPVSYEASQHLKTVSNYSLPKKWLSVLKDKADRVSIEFMCSAFSPELLDEVDPFVNVHKLASAEMNHVRMLEKLQEIGKPVFVSTGGHNELDIHKTLFYIDGPRVLLYCVAAYPAKVIHLHRIWMMRERFRCLMGYSDHSIDALVVPVVACHREKACVLEKHVNFTEHTDTPDAFHSLNQSEFKAMVDTLRDPNPSLFPTITGEENEMVKRHNRRLIATKSIQPGDTFQEGVNFGIYRSLKDDSNALSPFMIDRVNGITASRAYDPGEGIGLDP